MYNIVVWAITGAYFINIVFCFLSVFWGSFSWLGAGAVLCCRPWCESVMLRKGRCGV